MFDLNETGTFHFCATDGRDLIISPRRSTGHGRRTFDELRSLVIFSMLLLNSSPSYVEEWQRTLEIWTKMPVDILAVRKSRVYRGKVDAVLVINPHAEQWTVVTDLLRGGRRARLSE
jgi:virulence-associated protein VagC